MTIWITSSMRSMIPKLCRIRISAMISAPHMHPPIPENVLDHIVTHLPFQVMVKHINKNY